MKVTKKIFYVMLAILLLPIIASAKGLLTNLEVEGIEPLSMTKSTYNLTLTTTLDYVNIVATPANEGVTVTGAGKQTATEGPNTYTITATDGKDAETYTINVNIVKGDANVDEIKGNPNTGSFLPTSLVLLALLAIAMVILNKRKIFNI